MNYIACLEGVGSEESSRAIYIIPRGTAGITLLWIYLGRQYRHPEWRGRISIPCTRIGDDTALPENYVQCIRLGVLL